MGDKSVDVLGRGRPGDILARLDAVAPGAALVAFGQTPFWDEPLKAFLAGLTGRRIIVGIHDLDYFSRLRAPLPGAPWQMVGRNDGTLRDIWVAAGELSALFGAEAWPTRQELSEAGVRLERLLPTGTRRAAALDRLTAGWGWRGLVENATPQRVIRDIPASEAAPALGRLLDWGFRETARLTPSARRSLKELRAEIQECLNADAGRSLADAYLDLMRLFYRRLLGQTPANVEFQNTSALFRFNRATCRLPRFRFVEHFLNPKCAETARRAYNEAVAGSAMSELGDDPGDALPFDVYAPGRGRGTLRIEADRLLIQTDPPTDIPVAHAIRSLPALAEALEKALGPDAALIGKALTLPAMIGGEFVMMLTETGSAYMPRTQRMLAGMHAAGVPVQANPLLRLQVRTWDALAATDLTFRLPDHLARAFETSLITAPEFARRWRRVVRDQAKLLRDLRKLGTPCDMVRLLALDEHSAWLKRMEACNQARQTLIEVQKRADELRLKALHVRAKEDEVSSEIAMLERRRGELNRARIRPLKRALADLDPAAPSEQRVQMESDQGNADREGRALLLALEAKQAEKRKLRQRRSEIGRQLRSVERGGKAAKARRTLAAMERMAGRTAARLARQALLVTRALPQTELRPSAWWLAGLDPSGRWHDCLQHTARLRIEPLTEEAG